MAKGLARMNATASPSWRKRKCSGIYTVRFSYFPARHVDCFFAATGTFWTSAIKTLFHLFTYFHHHSLPPFTSAGKADSSFGRSSVSRECARSGSCPVKSASIAVSGPSVADGCIPRSQRCFPFKYKHIDSVMAPGSASNNSSSAEKALERCYKRVTGAPVCLENSNAALLERS